MASDRTCIVDDCGKSTGNKSRYCSMHQARVARWGHPLAVMHRFPQRPKEEPKPKQLRERKSPLRRSEPDPKRQCAVDGCLRLRGKGRRFCSFHKLPHQRPDGYVLDKLKHPCRRTPAMRHWFSTRYGITLDERDEMIEAQGNLCAACRVGPADVVDHCHASGDVRGVLCRKCNVALFALDDFELHARLMAYKTSGECVHI